MDVIEAMLEENRRRLEEQNAVFDPISGEGSVGERRKVEVAFPGEAKSSSLWLPEAMIDEPLVAKALEQGRVEADNVEEWERLRMKYDFAYWAAKYAYVKRKGGGEDCLLRLTRPQRKFVEALEAQRVANKPIRIVLLKARQWGGSTVSQLYMAWMQLCHERGLNSLIIAHQSTATEEIKDMFDRLVAAYPVRLLHPIGADFKEGEKKLVGVGKSRSCWRVPQRNCKIKIGTAERPDSCRGGDYNLVHLSEVAIWKATKGHKPEDIVRASTGGVLLRPGTMIVFESTANGVGNFFHKEYEAARTVPSCHFKSMFVAWHEIEQNSLEFETPEQERQFAKSLWDNRLKATAPNSREQPGVYLWALWEKCRATLQGIHWYVAERAKHSQSGSMYAECPSDDREAFVNSGESVFDSHLVDRFDEDCRAQFELGEVEAPASVLVRKGHKFNPQSLRNLQFMPDERGLLKIWKRPESEDVGIQTRYVAVVDIGGRSDNADWSVIAVFDRKPMMEGEGPEVVAQWRGHIDMDMLAWKAAQIAAFYSNALLVIESNTLETRDPLREVDGDQSVFILDQIKKAYPNLYARRQSPEDVRQGRPRKYGFHTNTSTKPMVISGMVRVVREKCYTERDPECLREMQTYERKPNGSYGAILGAHDDLLMTRAIGLHICLHELPAPALLPDSPSSPSSNVF